MSALIDYMKECMQPFVKGLGLAIYLALLACMIAALPAAATGALALPAVLACMALAGIGYAAGAVFSCLVAYVMTT